MLVYKLSKIAAMTDRELYKYCQDVGGKAREWKKRFITLIPEVAKRNLHRKCGFASIIDFAGRLGGVGQYTVEVALQIQKHIEDKPALLNVLPIVGVHKMRVIATIATKENQEFLAKKVVEMSKPALEVWAREIRPGPENANRTIDANGLNGAQNQLFGQPGEFENYSNMSSFDSHIHYSFDVDKNTDFNLRKCKLEMEKAIKRYATWCEVMQKLIDDKNNNDNKEPNNNKNQKKLKNNIANTITRHIPEAIKRDIEDKYQGKCGYPGCNKPSEILHHTKRFALNPNHENIVPLCASHHEITHNGLIKNETNSPEKWLRGVYSNIVDMNLDVKEKIDQKVRLFSTHSRPPNTS